MARSGGGSDPRRPQAAQPLNRDLINDDTRVPDGMHMAAMACGVAALILKMKAAAWASIFCALSALANMPHEGSEVKQMITTMTFAVMGLVSSYVVPVRG